MVLVYDYDYSISENELHFVILELEQFANIYFCHFRTNLNDIEEEILLDGTLYNLICILSFSENLRNIEFDFCISRDKRGVYCHISILFGW